MLYRIFLRILFCDKVTHRGHSLEEKVSFEKRDLKRDPIGLAETLIRQNLSFHSPAFRRKMSFRAMLAGELKSNCCTASLSDARITLIKTRPKA